MITKINNASTELKPFRFLIEICAVITILQTTYNTLLRPHVLASIGARRESNENLQTTGAGLFARGLRLATRRHDAFHPHMGNDVTIMLLAVREQQQQKSLSQASRIRFACWFCPLLNVSSASLSIRQTNDVCTLSRSQGPRLIVSLRPAGAQFRTRAPQSSSFSSHTACSWRASSVGFIFAFVGLGHTGDECIRL